MLCQRVSPCNTECLHWAIPRRAQRPLWDRALSVCTPVAHADTLGKAASFELFDYDFPQHFIISQVLQSRYV